MNLELRDGVGVSNSCRSIVNSNCRYLLGVGGVGMRNIGNRRLR